MTDTVQSLLRFSPRFRPQQVHKNRKSLTLNSTQLSLKSIHALLGCRTNIFVTYYAEASRCEYEVKLPEDSKKSRYADKAFILRDDKRAVSSFIDDPNALIPEQAHIIQFLL